MKIIIDLPSKKFELQPISNTCDESTYMLKVISEKRAKGVTTTVEDRNPVIKKKYLPEQTKAENECNGIAIEHNKYVKQCMIKHFLKNFTCYNATIIIDLCYSFAVKNIAGNLSLSKEINLIYKYGDKKCQPF